MEECYLATVWHTGTKYFKAGLEKNYRVAYSHFNDATPEKLKHYQTIFTTYRDPHRVAASWGNRGHFSKQDNSLNYSKWVNQWENYTKALELKPIILDFSKGNIQHGIDFGKNPINQHSDANGLHKALDENNLEYLYSFIPKEYIDLAIDCCREIYEG